MFWRCQYSIGQVWAGIYHVALQWNPDITDQSRAGPSVFTALQEQLGLRLRAQKTQVEMIVVDHAERPGEN